MNLIRNAIQTPDGTILESTHRHDYKSYTDTNGKTYMIDGGLAYVRSSGHADQVSLALYDHAPHEVQRNILKWGTYGINGDQPIKYVTIAEMDTAHIEAVVKLNVSPVHKACMLEELQSRTRSFTYSVNWMGPIATRWYEERDIPFVMKETSGRHLPKIEYKDYLESYSCGRIDIRGDTESPYGDEYGVRPMRTEDWNAFSDWLNTLDTTYQWSYNHLLEVFERETGITIRWAK